MTNTIAAAAADAAYADLRRRGEILLHFTEDRLIVRLRKLAKADGLSLVTTRGSRRDTRHMSFSQYRTRPYTVALVDPADPTTIVRPDAGG